MINLHFSVFCIFFPISKDKQKAKIIIFERPQKYTYISLYVVRTYKNAVRKTEKTDYYIDSSKLLFSIFQERGLQNRKKSKLN